MSQRLEPMLFRGGGLTRAGWVVVPIGNVLLVAVITWLASAKTDLWVLDSVTFVMVALFALLGGMMAVCAAGLMLIWLYMQAVLGWPSLGRNPMVEMDTDPMLEMDTEGSDYQPLSWSHFANYSFLLACGLSYVIPLCWYVVY